MSWFMIPIFIEKKIILNLKHKIRVCWNHEYVYLLQIYGVLPSNHNANSSRKLGGSIPIVWSATPVIFCDSFILQAKIFFFEKQFFYILHTCALAELYI